MFKYITGHYHFKKSNLHFMNRNSLKTIAAIFFLILIVFSAYLLLDSFHLYRHIVNSIFIQLLIFIQATWLLFLVVWIFKSFVRAGEKYGTQEPESETSWGALLLMLTIFIPQVLLLLMNSGFGNNYRHLILSGSGIPLTIQLIFFSIAIAAVGFALFIDRKKQINFTLGLAALTLVSSWFSTTVMVSAMNCYWDFGNTHTEEVKVQNIESKGWKRSKDYYIFTYHANPALEKIKVYSQHIPSTTLPPAVAICNKILVEHHSGFLGLPWVKISLACEYNQSLKASDLKNYSKILGIGWLALFIYIAVLLLGNAFKTPN